MTLKLKLNVSLPLGLAAYLAVVGLPAFAQIGAMQAQSVSGQVSSQSNRNPVVGGLGQGPIPLAKDFSQLRVEPGDLLSISIYDAPELSETYRVDAAGELKLPLCRKVRVTGKTSAEVALLLEDALMQDQILLNPQVDVDVQQFAGHFVTILGEVKSPGRVSVIAPTRLDEILAEAGGLTEIAGKHIEIRHGSLDGPPGIDPSRLPNEVNPQAGSDLVLPGDTVFVPRAGIVYVLGAVFHPGGFVMQEDGKLNVAEALSLAGGTLLTARANGLRVLRGNADGSVSDLHMSYDRIASGAEKPIELQAQDIVYVPMSKVKSVLTDATAILSAATSASIYSVR